MEIEELRIIADLTVELTKLRQNECKHLAVENAGPDIFYNLIIALENTKPQMMAGPIEISLPDPTSPSHDADQG